MNITRENTIFDSGRDLDRNELITDYPDRLLDECGRTMSYDTWTHSGLANRGDKAGFYAEYVVITTLVKKMGIAAKHTSNDEDMRGDGDVKVYTEKGPIYIDIKYNPVAYNKEMQWQRKDDEVGNRKYLFSFGGTDLNLMRSCDNKTIEKFAEVLRSIVRDADE